MKYSGFSILMWGAIKVDGTRVLVRCPNRLHPKEYLLDVASHLHELAFF